jgi:hypothetical protein
LISALIEALVAILPALPAMAIGAVFLGVLGYKWLGAFGAIVGIAAGGWLGLKLDLWDASLAGSDSRRSGWYFVIAALLLIGALAIATR